MANLTPEAMGVKSDADVAEMSARSADAAAEYVALLGAAARASRGRFAKRAALAFPRLKALLTNCTSEATEGLRERCLATLETFAGACAGASAEVRDELWAAETIRVALELCAYDPNVDADPIDAEEDSDAEDGWRGGGDARENTPAASPRTAGIRITRTTRTRRRTRTTRAGRFGAARRGWRGRFSPTRGLGGAAR
jgi:hypothetical protein